MLGSGTRLSRGADNMAPGLMFPPHFPTSPERAKQVFPHAAIDTVGIEGDCPAPSGLGGMILIDYAPSQVQNLEWGC